ncbi:nucleoside hydrolase [Cohnella caldifontis]|uniref:nucleoside hydrolase n=1 Tax=Cohnella caldifontis TaxID=3027471 RepID=UPI0023ED4783|nr:nucleoside hydrolase [Cohnella sp. YIM B05605]
MPQKVILDVDTGSDDAVAIMMAILAPEIDLVGICSVNGNKGIENTTENTLRTVQLLGSDVPVYKGCPAPMVKRLFPGRYGWTRAQKVGEVDGKKVEYHTDFLDMLPPASIKPQPQNAVSWLIDTLMASDGDITIVPVGPLTNLAMAIRIEPAIVSKIKEVILMGGGHRITNTTSAAEFNIWEDPEAAQIVLTSGCKVTLVPLDATHAAYVTAQESKEIRSIGTPAAIATADLIDQRIKAYNVAQPMKVQDSAPVHDALAVLAVIDPTVLQEVRFARIDVDISGGFADGMTIVDNRALPDYPKNAYIALDADREKFVRMLKHYLSKS